MTTATIKRDKPYTEDDFVVTKTSCGRTIRWKHNNRAIQHYNGYDAQKRAKAYIKWLIGWLNDPANGYVVNKEGK